MSDDDWSEPQFYGSPMPVPGDATALAVVTSQPQQAEDGWSSPIYHGPRRHRPRPDQPVRINRSRSGAQLVVGEQLVAEAPAPPEAPVSDLIPLPRADSVQAPSADSIQAPDVDSVLAPDVDRIQSPTADPAAQAGHGDDRATGGRPAPGRPPPSRSGTPRPA